MSPRWYLAILLIPACFALPAQASPPAYEMTTIRNVAYFDGPDADPVRHNLDLHLPKDCQNFPVLFFLHGGGWVEGHKDQFGIHTLLARILTRHGIGLVSPNYRLSPRVKHPEHIHDVARAFAWTYRNIGKYGGDPRELFVSGHSAGGHLCALLATDETYLRAEGLCLGNIKGAIPISGVFIVPPGKIFDPVFGKDPAVRKLASPINHVCRDCPPFLIFLGNNELPACDRPGADAFYRTLLEQKCQARLCEVTPRNHLSILLNVVKESDPVTRDLLCFITSQVIMDRLVSDPVHALEDLTFLVARFAAPK